MIRAKATVELTIYKIVFNHNPYFFHYQLTLNKCKLSKKIDYSILMRLILHLMFNFKICTIKSFEAKIFKIECEIFNEK